MVAGLIALLIAAPPVPARGQKAPLMAVLELHNKLKGQQREDVDVAYLTDVVRATALKQVKGLKVMTRENMVVLLSSSGKKPEDCEGTCEVDTGRMLGADLVVSGEMLKFGSALKLNLKLHETTNGRLLAGTQASGHDADELDKSIQTAVAELVAPVKSGAWRSDDEENGVEGGVEGGVPGGVLMGGVVGGVVSGTLPGNEKPPPPPPPPPGRQHAEAQTQAQLKAQKEAQAQAEAQKQAQAQAEAQKQAQLQQQAQQKQAAVPPPAAKPPEQKPALVSEARPEAKTEPKVESKPEQKVAPRPAEVQAASQAESGIGFGLYGAGVVDVSGKTFGGQALFVIGARSDFHLGLGVNISPHPGGRVVLGYDPLRSESFDLGMELRGIVAPTSQGTVFGGGPGVRLAVHAGGALDVVASVGVDFDKGPNDTSLTAPLLALGLELKL
ncbi:MAG: hypothetical protein JST92_02250 [Deltaproteobacteria bacterium]|nr:hypothetical protein [Deltaproteobacteria bacterium]